ncbi:hypothetical protein DL96DRAFT_206991 [Flagelloscypha sp. PMI_526]|nr:hypothetical protein DL96DRAFT_206991 [Flagelloscypha sp. PMI_526]
MSPLVMEVWDRPRHSLWHITLTISRGTQRYRIRPYFPQFLAEFRRFLLLCSLYCIPSLVPPLFEESMSHSSSVNTFSKGTTTASSTFLKHSYYFGSHLILTGSQPQHSTSCLDIHSNCFLAGTGNAFSRVSSSSGHNLSLVTRLPSAKEELHKTIVLVSPCSNFKLETPQRNRKKPCTTQRFNPAWMRPQLAGETMFLPPMNCAG